MRRLILLLSPALLFAAQARYARLGQFDGSVEVQLQAAAPWIAAEPNLPLPEATWIRTGADSRLEIELDEGSVFRLGAEAQAEISDYTRLSTGQRVTLLSIDHGIAWFTGQSTGKDVLSLVVPGAQVTFENGARIRLEAGDVWSTIAVLQGTVRFSCPAAEIDLREGQTARVEPANPSRFFLDREIAAIEMDRWSTERDKVLAAPTSAPHAGQQYGAQDLDTAGEWIQTNDLGAVWKPKLQEGWHPFQKGRWRWYDTLGYTWVSDDSWGWLPYHYGRWAHREILGWVWVPNNSSIFKPGEVYWLRGNAKAPTLVAWGPLAPGELWDPADKSLGNPRQFLNAWLNYADFHPEADLIDPATFAKPPKDPLEVADFLIALPSPTFLSARLEAVRPELRVGSTRITPFLEGVTFQRTSTRPVVVINPTPPPIVVVKQAPRPAPEEVDVPYPVPVITGIVTLNSPGQPIPQRTSGSAPPAKTTTASNTPPPAKSGGRHPGPKPPSGRQKQFRKPAEYEVASAAIQDVESRHFSKAISELDTWAQKYSESDFKADRLYYYVLAYDGTGQPGRVLDTAAQLLGGLEKSLEDPRQEILTLYLATVNIQKLTYPSHDQFTTGQAAARNLLDAVDRYFTDANRPAGTSSDDWRKAQTDLVATARTTLASLAARQRSH